MRQIRPYVSVDLETTGLSMKSQILEFAFVYDDGLAPVDKLDKRSFVISHDSFTHCEPYALNMNAALMKQIAEKKDTVSLRVAMQEFHNVLLKASEQAQEYDKVTKAWRVDKKVCIAGKNAATFDIPLLRTNGDYLFQEDVFALISHRVIDVGSMHYPDFGFIPSLGEINKRIGGRDEVSHRALDDAMDVVKAVRCKFLVNA